MIISTSQKRHIGRQTGDLSVQMDLYVSDTTGTVEIGLSGDADNNYFLLGSGKIFNRYGEFVSSYRKNSKIPIKINVDASREVFDYSFHGKLNTYFKDAYFEGSFVPDYSYFYVKTTNSVATISDLSIEGETSTMSPSTGNVAHTGNEFTVSYTLENTGLVPLFYSATLLGDYGYKITNSGISAYSPINTSLELTFQQVDPYPAAVAVSPIIHTSLGSFSGTQTTFTGSGIVDNLGEFIINFTQGSTSIERSEFSESHILTYNETGTGNYYLALEYVAGDLGSILAPASGTGIGSGYVYEYIEGYKPVYSDFLTGVIDLYSANQFSNSQLASGNGYFHVYATGDVSYDYTVEGVALISGSLYTGIFTGNTSATVLDGSGYYYFNYDVEGEPLIAYNASNIIVPSGVTFTGTLNDYILASGYRSGILEGYFLGVGEIDEGPKTFFSTWLLETGYFGDTGNYVSYYDEGWTGVNIYSNSGVLGSYNIEEDFNNIVAKITYTNPYSVSSTDIVKLKVGTPLSSFEVFITGNTPTSTAATGVVLYSGEILNLNYEQLLNLAGLPLYF